jgi:hypothetical protein
MNLLRNMIVGNKEIRRNRKKRKQIQERRIKNLTLITSVIELARIELTVGLLKIRIMPLLRLMESLLMLE